MNYSKQDKTIATKRLDLRIFEETDTESVIVLCNNYNTLKNAL